MTKALMEDQLATKRPRISSGFVFKSVFGESEDLMLELLELSLGTKIANWYLCSPSESSMCYPTPEQDA